MIEFKFDRFNPRRAMRGVEAASLVVDDSQDPEGPCMLWMSKADVGRNMIAFGRQPALVEAWDAYMAYETDKTGEPLGLASTAELGPVRYVLCPGYVVSARDGDEHFIGARQLAFLYSVPLNQCAIPPDHRTPQSLQDRFWSRHANLPKLVPRYDGDYRLPGPNCA